MMKRYYSSSFDATFKCANCGTELHKDDDGVWVDKTDGDSCSPDFLYSDDYTATTMHQLLTMQGFNGTHQVAYR